MNNYSTWAIPTSTIDLLWHCMRKVPAILSTTLAVFITSIRRILFLITYTFVGSLLTLSGPTTAWAADFDIDRASYSVSRDRLSVRGDAEDDAEVRLFDDDSNVLFATVSADSDGNWRYRKNDPQAIPCRVRAESEDNKTDERNVRKASQFPGGCGISPPTTTTTTTSTTTTLEVCCSTFWTYPHCHFSPSLNNSISIIFETTST